VTLGYLRPLPARTGDIEGPKQRFSMLIGKAARAVD
jgi:hypothetical protein